MQTLYPFPQKKATSWLLGIWFLGILMVSRDCMLSMAIWGFYKAQVVSLALMGAGLAAFLCFHFRSVREMIKDRRAFFALCVVAAVLFPAIFKRDWQLMYCSVLIAILFGVFVSYFLSLKDGAKLYVWVLTFLAAYSVLATYVFKKLSYAGVLPMIRFINPANIEFFNYGFAYSVNGSIRNFGIFREPGVYQFFLLLGLYLANYRVEWEKPWQLWSVNLILSVTMLTTYATGGIVEMVLFWLFIVVDKKYYRKRWAWGAGALILLGAAGAVLYLYLSRSNVFYELISMVRKLYTVSPSGTDRVGSVVKNLGNFLSNPLVGRNLKDVLFAVDNNTSSSTILLAILGIAGGGMHIAGWFCLVWESRRHWIGNCLLTLILAMSFNTANLITNPFFWLFPTMAICQLWLPKLDTGKEQT